MRLLCDTQIILWVLYKASRLKPHIAGLIANRENDVFFSSVSLWEIALKVRTGKLQADVEEVHATCRAIGMAFLKIESPHLVAVSQLTNAPHDDPFDHLLIAQAKVERVSLLTADRVVQRYPVDIIKA